MFLRQSTIQAILFGPFLDSTDGVTAETGLTIAQADRQISKDGAVFAQSGEIGNSTHDTDGWYVDNLTAADTDTVGVLKLQVVVAGSVPVWETFYVVEEAVYDALYAASAAGYGTAQTGDNFARLGAPAGASVAADVAAVKVDTAATLTDTADMQPKLGTPAADVSADIAALNDISVSDILTTQMTESYSVNGTAPTLAQSLFLMQGMLTEFKYVETTLTINGIDGTTAKATFTYDDANRPTLLSRTT